MITVTDDMDVACFSLVWDGDKPVINTVSSDELEALPEWVTDTINIGMIATHGGVMYGPNEGSLLDEPLWSR